MARLLYALLFYAGKQEMLTLEQVREDRLCGRGNNKVKYLTHILNIEKYFQRLTGACPEEVQRDSGSEVLAKQKVKQSDKCDCPSS